MGAFVIRIVAVTSDFPANVVSMHATLARLDVCSACSNIVFHAYGLVVILPKLDCAPFRNLNFAFPSSFVVWSWIAFSFPLRLCFGHWIRLEPLIAARSR